MHELAFPLLVGLIAIALAFDFLNGLHDAANSIATVVSTRLLSPVVAVLFAAFGNFAAYWLVGLHVAETVGKTTQVVVAGADAGSKLDKAKALGILVLDEAEFAARLSESDARSLDSTGGMSPPL